MHCSVSLPNLARVAHWSAVAMILVSLRAAHAAPAAVCPETNSGITLSPGFCASIFADNIGHARHLVVSPSGVVYVNTWSGNYYNSDPIPPGGFLVALKDTKSTGKADVVKRFGESKAEGAAGGTGIALYQGAIYAEMNDRIMRYTLATNAIVPSGKGEIVVSFFLPARPAHASDAYQRFTPRTEMDIAVVGVAVNLALDAGGTCTAARVALGAVAPTVLLVKDAVDALIGTRLDDAALDRLAKAASAACRPIDDKRGTKEYRVKVAGVLARRTAQQALERARKSR